MPRILLLTTIVAARLCAGTISYSTPCAQAQFTTGHMQVSNCQVIYIESLATPMNASIGDIELVPDPSQAYVLHQTGQIFMQSDSSQSQFINVVITASFTMDPGWNIFAAVIGGVAAESGIAVSDGGLLLAPCATSYGETTFGFCETSSPLPSGTLTFELQINSGTFGFGYGTVGGSTIELGQFFAPEPNTVVLIGLGMAGVCLFSRPRYKTHR